MGYKFASLVVVFFSSFFSLAIHAQHNDRKFTHLTTQNGLSEDVVQSIFQDSEGYLWFGTKDGLDCYDGNNFTVYSYDPNVPGTLSSNLVNDIFEDSHHTLWIGTFKGINRFDRQSRTFFNYKIGKFDHKKISQNSVSSIMEDKNGNLWIGTFDGLNMHVKSDDSFIKYFNIPGDSTSLNSSIIWKLFKDKKGDLWIITSNGLNKFDYSTRKFIQIKGTSIDTKITRTYQLGSLYEDVQGTLWFGYDDGLYIVNRSNNTLSSYVSKKDNALMQNIRDIKEDNQRNFWIGCVDGLLLLNKRTKSIISYEHDDLDPYSLTKNEIWKLFVDFKGTLWIGTFTGGVNILNQDNDFKLYQHEANNDKSLSKSFVLSFLEDTDGDFWIGADAGGLNKFDRKSNTFKTFWNDPAKPNSISSNTVLSLFQDSRKEIWIGTWTGGVNLFDKHTGKFTRYGDGPNNNKKLNNPHVWAIMEDRKHNLWFGTMGGGINILDRKSNTFTYIVNNTGLQPGSNQIPNSNVWALCQDKAGTIWAGTSYGLFEFDPSSGKSNVYLPDENNPTSLGNGWVICIYEDHKGRLWIGTHGGGLNLLDRKTGKFTIYRKKDGLLNDVIHGILEDKHGNLWMSTNVGISKFDPEHKIFKNFDVSHGLQGNQFSMGAYLKSKSGEMFFGGPNGFNVFHPDSIHGNRYVPPIVFSDFLIFNESVKPGPNAPLKKYINECDQVTLKYSQSVFTIKFSALNFINPGKNEYSYILEGFEKKWNNVGHKTEATYTNLDPGVYTFKVIASNNDGVWNTKGKSVKIVVTPPYWKTIWFRLLGIGLLLTLLLGIYSWRMAQTEKANILLKKLVEERTRDLELRTQEIEEKNNILLQQAEELNAINTLLEERQQHIEEQAEELTVQRDELGQLNATKDKLFSILAHDLRNPFHVIIGFSELILADFKKLSEEKIQRFLSLIHSSSKRGNDLLENILQWSRTQTGRISFSPELLELSKIVYETFIFLEGEAQTKHIVIQHRISETLCVTADSNMLKTILRNLLSNAIKFTPENGKISIDASINGNYAYISISDSGVGIPKENQKKLFRIDTNITTKGTNQESGTGLGLLLCKEFVERHGGKIWLESEIDKGTTFHFTIPTNLAIST